MDTIQYKWINVNMPHPWVDPQYRYMNDATFRTLVDSLTKLIREAKITPTELREACLLAQIHYEQLNERMWHMTREEAIQMGIVIED